MDRRLAVYKRWLHKDLWMHFFEVLQLKVNLHDKALESKCTYMYFSCEFNELFSSVKAPNEWHIILLLPTYLYSPFVILICIYDKLNLPLNVQVFFWFKQMFFPRESTFFKLYDLATRVNLIDNWERRTKHNQFILQQTFQFFLYEANSLQYFFLN